MNKPRLFSTNEAAAYLGIHPQVLRYHIYTKNHLQPDHTTGGDLVFLQSTLDEFKATHQAEGLTMQEAADLLGVDRNWIHYHVYRSKKLQAIGKRGKSWVFSPESVEALRPLAEEEQAAPNP